METKVTLSRAQKIADRVKEVMNHAQAEMSAASQRQTGILSVEVLKKRSSEANQRFQKALMLFTNASFAYKDIRVAIGNANQKEGIGELMAERENCKRMIHAMKMLKGNRAVFGSFSAEGVDMEDFETMVFGADETTRNRLMNMGVNMVDLDECEKLEILYTKNLTKISDEISDLNAKKISIMVSDEIAKEIGLI